MKKIIICILVFGSVVYGQVSPPRPTQNSILGIVTKGSKGQDSIVSVQNNYALPVRVVDNFENNSNHNGWVRVGFSVSQYNFNSGLFNTSFNHAIIYDNPSNVLLEKGVPVKLEYFDGTVRYSMIDSIFPSFLGMPVVCIQGHQFAYVRKVFIGKKDKIVTLNFKLNGYFVRGENFVPLLVRVPGESIDHYCVTNLLSRCLDTIVVWDKLPAQILGVSVYTSTIVYVSIRLCVMVNGVLLGNVGSLVNAVGDWSKSRANIPYEHIGITYNKVNPGDNIDVFLNFGNLAFSMIESTYRHNTKDLTIAIHFVIID
jgi:hypothetical protein